MKYFDEKKMGEIRKELEKEILRWPGVSTREMMGCLCYLHGKNMLAFLVTDGIVVSKLSEQEEKDLSKLSKKASFKMGGKTIKKPVWQLKTQDNLRTILPILKKSYQAAVKIKK
jgi:TfoX/Sxy family transcriptional regulator of competence genes